MLWLKENWSFIGRIPDHDVQGVADLQRKTRSVIFAAAVAFAALIEVTAATSGKSIFRDDSLQS